MRTKFSKIALAVILGIALAFNFSCSSDDGDDDSGDNSYAGKSSSNTVVLSSSSIPSSSSSSISIVIGSQYYDVILGGWSVSCPSLSDYPDLINVVMPLDDTWMSLFQTCLINTESYVGNTGSQVSNFLATNGLSGFANAFNSRIAESTYGAASLIYVNTSNYYRVLIIGYGNENIYSSSSGQTPSSEFCDYMVTSLANSLASGAGAGLISGSVCSAIASTLLNNYPACLDSDSYKKLCSN